MKKLREIAYSFGAVATALSYQAFAAWIFYFYIDIRHLAPMLAALAMIIYGAWNALNDPLAGYISDRTRTKWGRRIPYIAVGAIPFGIIYFLLWVPPFSASTQMFSLFLYFLFIISLFDTFYTFIILNWASLFPEMFPSLRERVEVNGLRQLFGVFGLVIGIALSPLIYSNFGWSKMGALYGIIITLSLLISLIGSKEKKVFCYDAPLNVKDAIVNSLANRSFLTFVISNLLIQYTFTMVLVMLPFFAKYVLGGGELEKTLILLVAFVFEMPMLFIWGRMAIKLGAKTTYLIAIAFFGIALIPFLFVGNVIGTAITAGFLGAGLAGIIVLSDVLISDIIDEDELKTNTRREGMYFGVNAFVTRFAIGLEGLSVGFVFQVFGYNSFLKIQPPSFLVGTRILIAALPMLAMLLALLIMRFYPLTGERLREVRDKLQKLHDEKLEASLKL